MDKLQIQILIYQIMKDMDIINDFRFESELNNFSMGDDGKLEFDINYKFFIVQKK